MTPLSIMIITMPIAYPLAVSGLGYDGIWFGVIMTILMEIAVVTPPMGINLCVIKEIFPDISLGDIIRGSIWFLVMELIVIGILIAFPLICTLLPSTMW